MKRLKPFLIITIAGIGSVAAYYLHGMYNLAQLDAAIGEVRRLGEAETEFASTSPQHGYTCNFSDLSGDGEALKELASTGQQQGYAFEIGGCKNDQSKPNRTYFILAHSADGIRVGADQSRVIRYDSDCDSQ